MLSRRLLLLAAAACGLPGSAQAADPVVVAVRRGSELAGLGEADLKRLYAGGTLASAARVRLYDYGSDLPIRDAFYRVVTGRSGRQMHAFWVQYLFSGAGRGPTWVSTEAEMVAALAGDKSGVGYLRESALGADLEVLWRLSGT